MCGATLRTPSRPSNQPRGRFGGARYTSSYRDGTVVAEAEREILGAGVALTGAVAPYAPLGILLEYRFRKTIQTLEELEVADLNISQHRIGMGFFYTGRDDLMLGIFASSRLWRGENEPRTYVLGQIVMQYFF